MRRFSIIVLFIIFFVIIGKNSFAQDVSNKLQLLEIVISNLVSRVESLEKRINVLEKHLTGVTGETPSDVKSKRRMDAEVYSENFIQPPAMEGYEDIGNGFFVKNVRFSPFGENVLFTGEITNKSGKNYRFAKFKVKIYDDRGAFFKEEEFTIPDIPKDSTKSFESMIIGLPSAFISKYEISFVNK
ncbi:MAG: hypothetical protein E3K37_14470 [Candidatus Kuenenia sp.]|nr:hypothetical protein [Candidatus Kuenenia hertensis]